MDYIKLNELKKRIPSSDTALRLVSQLEYGAAVSRTKGGVYDGLLSGAVDYAFSECKKSDAITPQAVLQAERLLLPLSAECKKITVLCAAHAHIDMNWMWGYDETTDITLATFRTMLTLMDEYPDFTFSQSQASVYEIVEQHDPEMLERIKRRIKEGRWEVTASTWVETDKNMVSGEGLSRHILYTKKYLSHLLDLPADYFCLDFEPDTFGHSLSVPEICAAGGVKYYYRCRGEQTEPLTRWRSRENGKSILSFCEPSWYNAAIRPYELIWIPEVCEKYKLDKMLKVYGVGDHGGGATRADIEMIKRINEWPIMPRMQFSTYREFFGYADAHAQNVGEKTGELNFCFTGCYTSQSRIKKSNRQGELAFKEAEKLAAFRLEPLPWEGKRLEKAWKKHLFNHFHDILPGSGVIETREYALAEAQKRNALLGAVKTDALLALAESIDLSGVQFDDGSPLAAGAGVGYAAKSGIFCGAMAHGGARPYLAFNQSALEKDFVFELTLWDFDYPLEQISVLGADGTEQAFELVDTVPQHYWGHIFVRLSVKVHLKANEYKTLIVRADANKRAVCFYDASWSMPPALRRHEAAEFVLENEYIRAEFDSRTCNVKRLVNKRTGEVLQGEAVTAFKYVEENGSKGMTSWVCGTYQTQRYLQGDARVLYNEYKPSGLIKRFAYIQYFGASEMKVEVTLKEGDSFLEFHTTIDFRELGKPNELTPSLLFCVRRPEGARLIMGAPYAVIEREELDEDRAAIGFAAAESGAGALVLATDSKYGYRCYNGEMAVNLIRASTDPDPYPEVYRHEYRICLGLTDKMTRGQTAEYAESCISSVNLLCFKAGDGGKEPPDRQLYSLAGNAVLSCVKPAEGGRGKVFRFYCADGKAEKCTLTLCKAIEKAYVCDTNENVLWELKAAENTVDFTIERDGFITLLIL